MPLPVMFTPLLVPALSSHALSSVSVSLFLNADQDLMSMNPITIEFSTIRDGGIIRK